VKKKINIYADDDLEQLVALRQNVEIAERTLLEAKAQASRLGDTAAVESEAVEAARAAYDAFVDEAAERAEEWVLSNIGHTEFRELVKAHPPRKIDDPDHDGEGDPKQVTHPDDVLFGINTEDFGRPLLAYVDPEDDEIRTIVSPTDQVAKRLKRLSAGQFDTLWTTAFGLNTGGVVDPKSLRYSTAPTSSAT